MTESAACSVEEEIRVALHRGRKWNSWQLIWTNGGPGAVDCSAVEQAMREELQDFFQDLSVHTKFVGEAGDRIAIRISISDRLIARSAQRKTTTIYLLYFLRSDLVLASSCKAEYATYLKHALCGVLGCSNVADRGLSGRQIDALKELVLAPACSSDLLEVVMDDDAGTAGTAGMNRKSLHGGYNANPATRQDDLVFDELGSSKRMRVHEQTASERPGPLQHVSIRVTEPSGRQVMKVTLNGPDALQGMRDLAEGGLLYEPPLPLRNLVLGVGVPSNEINLVLGSR